MPRVPEKDIEEIAKEMKARDKRLRDNFIKDLAVSIVDEMERRKNV